MSLSMGSTAGAALFFLESLLGSVDAAGAVVLGAAFLSEVYRFSRYSASSVLYKSSGVMRLKASGATFMAVSSLWVGRDSLTNVAALSMGSTQSTFT